MRRKTITITEQQENWVRSMVESGDYGNDSEYFRDLIRRDQRRRSAEAELREMLDAAEASGVGERTPGQILDAVRERLRGGR